LRKSTPQGLYCKTLPKVRFNIHNRILRFPRIWVICWFWVEPGRKTILGLTRKYRISWVPSRSIWKISPNPRKYGKSAGSAIFFIFSSEEPNKSHISSSRPQEPIHIKSNDTAYFTYDFLYKIQWFSSFYLIWESLKLQYLVHILETFDSKIGTVLQCLP